MASRPQLECVIGESGAGKSLYVSAFQCVEFLRDEGGDYWHNLPLKAEGLAERSGKSVDEVERRLKLIPEEELKTWREGKGGPWSFFVDKDIKGAHIAIDEAHRYFGKKHSKEHLHSLGEWAGGLRHSGATAQLITQHEFKLSTDARNEAGVQTRIFSPNQRKEPFTGAKYYDVLQLLAKLRCKKIGLTIVREGVSSGKNVRDFFNDGLRFIWHRAEHYRCYDSYNNLNAEGAEHDGHLNRPKEEWERYSWPRLLKWYVERNYKPTALRVAGVAAFVWLFALGGLGTIVDGVFETARNATAAMSPDTPEEKARKEAATKGKGGEPQPTLAALPQDNAKLQELIKHNQYLALKLTEASQYAEQLTGLVAVVKDTAYWADGSTAKTGDVVQQGAFAGARIEAIDPKAGTVRLSNDRILRVGVLTPDQFARVRAWQAAANGEAQPANRSAVPAAQGSVPSGSPAPVPVVGESGARSSAGDSPVLGNPGTTVLPSPRRSIRHLRGGGTGTGSANGDGGLSGHPVESLPVDGWTPVGRRTDRTPGPVLPGTASSGGQGNHGPEDPSPDP